MLLVIDGGNSETVFGLHDGRRFRARLRLASDRRRPAADYAAALTPRLRLDDTGTGGITDVMIACDVPESLGHLKAFCRDYLRVAARAVGDPGVSLGLSLRTDPLGPVGHDRMMNAIAAARLVKGARLVVDFGTATTLDVVNADGSLEGGVIVPGGEVMRRALRRRIALLPEVTSARPERVIGRDTASALRAGCYWGTVALIEGLIGRIRRAYRRPLTVIATGGLAAQVAAATPLIQRLEPDLTLLGLVEVARRNARGH